MGKANRCCNVCLGKATRTVTHYDSADDIVEEFAFCERCIVDYEEDEGKWYNEKRRKHLTNHYEVRK